MKPIRTVLITMLCSSALGVAAGCSTFRGAEPRTVSADHRVSDRAQIAQLNADLWVVTGQSKPTFYADGQYWIFADGLWYRSAIYDRGWMRSYRIPPSLHRLDQPEGYARYRARSGQEVRYLNDHHRLVEIEREREHADWQDYRYFQGRRLHGQKEQVREAPEARPEQD